MIRNDIVRAAALKWLFAGFVVCWMSACSPYLFSPPARMAPTELSTNPERGQKEINANVGLHTGVFEDAGPIHVQGAVAYGVTDDVAVQGSMSIVHLIGQSGVSHGASQNIAALRAGVGYSPPTNRQWLRFTSGVGVGTSAAGGFISPDVGINLSYDNRYVVPFANYSAWVSLPERNAAVTLRWGDENYFDDDEELFEGGFTSDEIVVETLPVNRTWGYTISLGMAIRMEGFSKQINWMAGESPDGLALVLAANLHKLQDGDETTGYLGLTVGFMHRF